MASRIGDLGRDIKAAEEQLKGLTGLREYTLWDDLDAQQSLHRIKELRAEAERIRSSSDELAALVEERQRVDRDLETVDEKLTDLVGRHGAATQRRHSAEERLLGIGALLEDVAAVDRARQEYEEIERLVQQKVGALANADAVRDAQQDVAADVAYRRQERFEEQHKVGVRAVRLMSRFREAYPHEADELDDSVDSAAEYRTLHRRVAQDDLPRFETEFKRYLNENTIREIASLSAQLNKHEATIRERVERINASLREIDYNDGRYIRLVADRTPNMEVRAFREDLRACTADVVGAGEDEQYSEARFLQVKLLIDRFKGREGFHDQDRAWTRRVTDVRQWFVFSASERWRVDESEYENYTDSAGKSGGQKEKLAYTILAASLAYQFKLDWDGTESRAFRFVVIDEAFGRGSDDSTRYALRLFTRLGLQLLIVTPLQKIHVIEPHVARLGFVDNIEGNNSRLQCITVEEQRRRRSALQSPSGGRVER